MQLALRNSAVYNVYICNVYVVMYSAWQSENWGYCTVCSSQFFHVFTHIMRDHVCMYAQLIVADTSIIFDISQT